MSQAVGPQHFEQSREWALDLLASAYAGGLIDVGELETRSAQALAVRTEAEIDQAVASIGLSLDERGAIIDEVIARWTADGWDLAIATDTVAALVLRRRPNHLLHALLTLFTGGFWLFVWIAITIGAVDERLHVEVDEFGNVSIRRVR